MRSEMCRRISIHVAVAPFMLSLVLGSSLSGCWLAAGALGAEGGYIASQDDKSVGETIDDQVISSTLKTRMLADPEVSGLKINVDVDHGVATLRGYVRSVREKERAIQLARATKGVKRVDSRLVLDSGS